MKQWEIRVTSGTRGVTPYFDRTAIVNAKNEEKAKELAIELAKNIGITFPTAKEVKVPAMKKYNCTICGAGCYSADETKTICAECEKDGNLVEVVRCKDCDHFSGNGVNTWCTKYGEIYSTPNDYCSWGERRTRK